jgi:lysophospholipase L1-like esterase
MKQMETENNLWHRFIDSIELIVSGYKSSKGDPDAWEKTIQKFESYDHLHPPVMGSILFVGSSSFTFWTTLQQDMAPLPVINRGFGGSHMRDIVRYVDRIVLPYQPRAIVVFAGTNDIVEANPDLAEQIFDGYHEFVTRVRKVLPEVRIYFLAITPTPTRWKFWPIAVETNRLVEKYTQNESQLGYIDFTEQLLSKDGKPDRSLYKFDGIHPNQKCYAIWTSSIKNQLQADFSIAELPLEFEGTVIAS